MTDDDRTDCPECGRRVTGLACACGWRAPVDAEATSCAGCKREAAAAERTPPGHFYCVNRCARCGAHSQSVTAFHPDDDEAHPSDRGMRLCPSCWIPALRRRTEGTASHCPEPECALTLAEHIAVCRTLASSDAWTVRFSSRRPTLLARVDANGGVSGGSDTHP